MRLAKFNEAGEQRTAGWKFERAGAATGSKFADAIHFLKDGKESAKRRDYRLQLVVERLTGVPASAFSTKAMSRGTEIEPDARSAYELLTGTFVEEVGFIDHPEIEWCGVSVDGLVGDDGTIEIKCPNPETHMSTLLLGRKELARALLGEASGHTSLVPEEHLPQIQGGLWVTKRKWCDFISYDPRFPKNLQLYVQRVERDEEYISKLEAGVRKFLVEVEDSLTAILGVNAASAEPDVVVNDALSQAAALRKAQT